MVTLDPSILETIGSRTRVLAVQFDEKGVGLPGLRLAVNGHSLHDGAQAVEEADGMQAGTGNSKRDGVRAWMRFRKHQGFPQRTGRGAAIVAVIIRAGDSVRVGAGGCGQGANAGQSKEKREEQQGGFGQHHASRTEVGAERMFKQGRNRRGYG